MIYEQWYTNNDIWMYNECKIAMYLSWLHPYSFLLVNPNPLKQIPSRTEIFQSLLNPMRYLETRMRKFQKARYLQCQIFVLAMLDFDTVGILKLAKFATSSDLLGPIWGPSILDYLRDW